MIDLMIADDYAVIEDYELQYYYGYEETTPAGEWCFVVRQKRTGRLLCSYTKSSLQARVPRLTKEDAPSAFLLVGITLYFQEQTP